MNKSHTDTYAQAHHYTITILWSRSAILAATTKYLHLNEREKKQCGVRDVNISFFSTLLTFVWLLHSFSLFSSLIPYDFTLSLVDTMFVFRYVYSIVYTFGTTKHVCKCKCVYVGFLLLFVIVCFLNVDKITPNVSCYLYYEYIWFRAGHKFLHAIRTFVTLHRNASIINIATVYFYICI